MRRVAKDNHGETTPSFNQAARSQEKHKKRSKASPVTLRLTPAERQKLESLAVGMTLSAYIRACIFAKEEKRRKRRPQSIVADKRAIAEVLALLGQSRIASNLNQLAHHANMGLLIEDEDTKNQIAEANSHLLAIRTTLIRALEHGS